MLRRRLGPVLVILLSACGGAVDGSAPGGSPPPSESGPVASPTGSPPGPGTAPPPPPPTTTTTACAPLATPFQDAFETAISTPWRGANVGALRVDTTAPIAGAGSLAVTLPPSPGSAYLGLSLASACRATFAFTVRAGAEVVTGYTPIARVLAGPVTLWVVLNRTRGVEVAVESRRSGGVSFVTPVSIALDASTPTRVELRVDGERGVEVAAGVPSSPLPAAVPVPTQVAPGGVTSFEIGAVIGIQRSTTGTVWFDDVEVR